MNDLEDETTCTISKFADDTKLSNSVTNDQDIQNLQEDLNKLMEWSDTWTMKFNVDKCSVMHFGHNNPQHEYQMNGKTLKCTREEKDLGVWITDDLKVAKQLQKQQRKQTEHSEWSNAHLDTVVQK